MTALPPEDNDDLIEMAKTAVKWFVAGCFTVVVICLIVILPGLVGQP